MSTSQKNPQKTGNQNENNVTRYEQQILDTSSIGVLITRISDGTILYANKAIGGLLGIPDIDSVIGSPVPNFYWDSEERQLILQRFRAEGSILHYPLRARRPDNSMVWISISIQPFNYEGEQVILSEIVDISERKQAEAALAREQSFMRVLMDSTPDKIYFKDLQSRFLRSSKTLSEMFGVSDPSDIVGKSDSDFFTKEHAQLAYEDEQTIIRTGQPISKEERETWADRPDTWVLTTKFPLYDETGKLVGTFGVSRDITEHKQAEDILEQRIVALTVPTADVENLRFEDLFDLREIQEIQDAFAIATGVASIITEVDGKPITKASNFCYLCEHIIRKTEKGLANCYRSDAVVGRGNPNGPILQPCLSGGLWDAGASIHIGDRHIANWLIGQVLDESVDQESMLAYGREIEADEEEFRKALKNVTRMSKEKFAQVGQALFLIVGQLSNMAVQNIQQARHISERKLVEVRLNESETRYHLLSESTIEGIVIHDKGILLDANQTFATMFGYEQKEVIGMSAMDFLTPETREITVQNIRSGYEKPYDVMGLRKDGSTFPVEITGKAIPYQGSVVRVAALRDITERKQAEQTVRENEQRFRALFEGANDAIFTLREDKLIDCNSQTLKIFKLESREQIIGHSIVEFSPEFQPDGVSTVQKAGEKINLALRGEAQFFEWKHIHADGTPFDADVSLNRLEIGGEILVQAIIRDITERRQAEAELRQNELLLSNAIRISRMGYWDFDIATQMFIFNEQYYQTFHATTSEEMGGNQMSAEEFTRRFILPEDAAIVGTGIVRAIETNDPNFQDQMEIKNLTAQGELRWVSLWLTIEKDAQGRTIKLHGVNQDITERKRLESQVQQAFERRGYQVQVSTEISQEIASASEVSDLFDRVVTLTKERLGYYHTQLLRYDPAQDAVVLINGYGETGKQMLADGHKMPLGAGLIGAAAESGQTVMRPTLAEDPDWRPNPLLPDTQGEIAVPIKLGDQILGVLDVQSNQAGTLTEDDRLLLEGLCGQIAITMHSAELVETIRQNEARLAEAAAIAQLGSWELDIQTLTFTLTDEAFGVFRTTAKEQGGYQMSAADYTQKFVHPSAINVVADETRKAIETDDPNYTKQLEHRMIRADGSEGVIVVKIRVSKNEQGQTVKTSGIFLDITERKQAEEALRQSEALLTETLHAAKLAYWEHNLATNQFELNDQYYAICHTTAEQEGGYTMSPEHMLERFVHPEDQALINQAIVTGLQSTDRHYRNQVDHRVIYADGSGIGYASTETNIERDEQGHITRIYGSYQDITERVRQQHEMAERLEEINRLYRNLSHEGWKTYRETADLPTGFVFDQTGTKPMDGDALADGDFANIPMRVLGGEVVGTLTVANDPQHPTSPEDYTFLQQVSDQIALALESARLAAQTQSALAQTEKLSEASLRFARSADLQELLEEANKALGLPHINRALLGIFNYGSANELDSMDIVANWWSGNGHEPTEIGRHYTEETLNILSMFMSVTPVFFSDTFHDERINASTIETIFKRQNIHSMAALPLYLGSRQIGVMFLESEEPYSFTQDEIRLFSAMAPQIATVLENRRQYQRAQQQAERETTLNIISQKIQSATTVEAVLQIAARELGHALGAPMTIAQLSMKDKK